MAVDGKFKNIDSQNIKSGSINVDKTKTGTEIKQWEFFAKVDSMVTDYITKMMGIPSTLFTPAMVLPSKVWFQNIVKTIALIKAVMTKMRQINYRINKNNNKSTFSRKIVQLQILKSLERSKWEVIKRYKEK